MNYEIEEFIEGFQHGLLETTKAIDEEGSELLDQPDDIEVQAQTVERIKVICTKFVNDHTEQLENYRSETPAYYSGCTQANVHGFDFFMWITYGCDAPDFMENAGDEYDSVYSGSLDPDGKLWYE